MQATRIAIAGAGMIGQAHMAVIAQLQDQCVLSAVVDPSPAAAAIAARAHVPWFSSIDMLLASDRPDGIILATPNHLHVPQALQCIAAGLPVLLEKPIATTVKEAQILVDQVAQTHARLLIGHHRAHSTIMQKAKQVVDSGQLGRLVTIAGSATFFKPDQYFADGPWRTQAGGGPILINMIHEVHNLRMLCGEIVAVQAMASNAVRGFAVEDTVSISLRFESGALGSFLLSDTAASARSWEQTSQENKAYASYADEDCYVISGTQGSLAVPTMRTKIYAQAQDRSWWLPFDVATVPMLRDDPLVRQMQHFVQVIGGHAAPLVTAQDGLSNLRVTEAITEAAQHGGLVALAAE